MMGNVPQIVRLIIGGVGKNKGKEDASLTREDVLFGLLLSSATLDG